MSHPGLQSDELCEAFAECASSGKWFNDVEGFALRVPNDTLCMGMKMI